MAFLSWNRSTPPAPSAPEGPWKGTKEAHAGSFVDGSSASAARQTGLGQLPLDLEIGAPALLPHLDLRCEEQIGLRHILKVSSRLCVFGRGR
jgi:hypothetical protein